MTALPAHVRPHRRTLVVAVVLGAPRERGRPCSAAQGDALYRELAATHLTS